MLDDSITMKPLAARRTMQQQYGATTLPRQDLCYCTWTNTQGQSMIVDLIGHDEAQRLALLSYFDEATGKRGIWIALRDQSGKPDTWLWTAKQLADAENNSACIDDAENEFEDDQGNNAPIQVAPIYKDRRTEILHLGQILPRSDDEVQAQLRAEGLDDRLPDGYRRPAPTTNIRETEPALNPVRPLIPEKSRGGFMKFSGGKKKRR